MLLFKRSNLSFADVLEEDGGDVALTEVRQDNHDSLALELWALRQLQSCGNVSAGGDTNQQAFLGSQVAGCLDGLLGGGRKDFVEKLAVKYLRNEVSAKALDLVRASVAFRQDRGVGRLNGYQVQVWVLGLQEAACTGNGAAGAYASNEGVNLALCVFPNLRWFPRESSGSPR